MVIPGTALPKEQATPGRSCTRKPPFPNTIQSLSRPHSKSRMWVAHTRRTQGLLCLPVTTASAYSLARSSSSVESKRANRIVAADFLDDLLRLALHNPSSKICVQKPQLLSNVFHHSQPRGHLAAPVLICTLQTPLRSRLTRSKVNRAKLTIQPQLRYISLGQPHFPVARQRTPYLKFTFCQSLLHKQSQRKPR